MGSLNALAALFVPARQADEFEREEILNDAAKFLVFSVDGDIVALKTRKGRIFLEKDEAKKLVWFDYYPAGTADRVRFWMNESSVTFLGDALRQHPERRVPMERLMIVW